VSLASLSNKKIRKQKISSVLEHGNQRIEIGYKKNPTITANPGLEPTIYHTRGEKANHYATDAV
jgi:hypothetical protein